MLAAVRQDLEDVLAQRVNIYMTSFPDCLSIAKSVPMLTCGSGCTTNHIPMLFYGLSGFYKTQCRTIWHLYVLQPNPLSLNVAIFCLFNQSSYPLRSGSIFTAQALEIV